MPAPNYEDQIFINCPFDEKYFPIFRAVIFAVYRCGFYPNTALNFKNSLVNRLNKIEKSIENSKYGIHDISRTESEKGLPRFNMPFELGLFFGAQRYGDSRQKSKNTIILDCSQHRYKKFISDLNGVDIESHSNHPEKAIKLIRDWLKNESGRSTLPGENILFGEYRKFKKTIPRICRQLGFDKNNIPFNDYCIMVEKSISMTK